MPVALMCIFWHQPTKSVFIEELVEIIKPIKQHLKRMDGRGYFTDISKAIQSSLNLKKTFNKDHQGKWHLDYSSGKIYVDHLREIYSRKNLKKISPIVPPIQSLPPPPEPVVPLPPPRKYNTTKPLPGATVSTTKLIQTFETIFQRTKI